MIAAIFHSRFPVIILGIESSGKENNGGMKETMTNHRKRGLDPVINEECRIVILGSLPGDDSLQAGQYYAHRHNHFWPIVSHVFEVALSPYYEKKVEFLLSRKIALWDVLKCADRVGSSDGNIRNEVVNDFAAFFSSYPRIRRVAFNGTKAESAFRKTAQRTLDANLLSAIHWTRLPSTSPTPGRNVASFDEKVLAWQVIRDL